jgi:hypothetical protein
VLHQNWSRGQLEGHPNPNAYPFSFARTLHVQKKLRWR